MLNLKLFGIQISLCMNKGLLEDSYTHLSVCCLWLFCTKTAVSSWVVTTEAVHLTKPEIFTIGPFVEKVCQPLFWILLRNVFHSVEMDEGAHFDKGKIGWRHRISQGQESWKQEEAEACVEKPHLLGLGYIYAKHLHRESVSVWITPGFPQQVDMPEGWPQVFYTSFLLSTKDSLWFFWRNYKLEGVRLGDYQSFLIILCTKGN